MELEHDVCPHVVIVIVIEKDALSLIVKVPVAFPDTMNCPDALVVFAEKMLWS